MSLESEIDKLFAVLDELRRASENLKKAFLSVGTWDEYSLLKNAECTTGELIPVKKSFRGKIGGEIPV